MNSGKNSLTILRASNSAMEKLLDQVAEVILIDLLETLESKGRARAIIIKVMRARER